MATVVWVLIFFLTCHIVSAFAAAMNRSSGADLVLNRSLNGLVSGLSSGAAANSGFIVIGAVGMGYAQGLSSLLLPFAWLIGDICFWSCCSRQICTLTEELNSRSVAELISHNTTFSVSRRLSAGLIVFFLTVYLVAQILSAVKAIKGQTELDTTAIIIIFTLLSIRADISVVRLNDSC